MTLRAPYPWFGGKRRVADIVWRAFGRDVPNYVEPFFGSGAVLLGRPGGAGKIETANDINCDVANFWRAVVADPLAVAAASDWPVNEADMHAVHLRLVQELPEHREKMHTDPEYFDARRAGLWVWGLCMWIGGGWVVEPKTKPWAKRPRMDDSNGVGVHSDAAHSEPRDPSHWQQRPHMTGNTPGMGVHSDGAHAEPSRKLPNLAVKADGACAGRGILSDAAVRCYSPGRRPRMSDAGNGVHLPSLGNDRGLNGVAAPPALEWFRQLQTRLRRVRIACGDWTRVLGDSVLGKGKNVGGRRPCAVFLDPPYDRELRNTHLYAEDELGLAARVREWALEHGDDPDLRIALCGYAGEHEMPATWTEHAWKAARGYAGADNENREQERVWFSPHCLPIEQQADLFNRPEAP